jgi:hypothetical protein
MLRRKLKGIHEGILAASSPASFPWFVIKKIRRVE